MLPPGDSLHHQNLKVDESLSSKEPTSMPPPPAYTAASTTFPLNYDTLGPDVDGEEDTFEAFAPITISIDASVSIEGNNNTVVLPTSQQSNQQIDGTPIALLQTMPNERASTIASTVMKALKDADLLCKLDDHDAYYSTIGRPIDVTVNSSISVKGDRNVICSGISKVIRRPENLRQPRSMNKGSRDMERKRRAESVRYPPSHNLSGCLY